MNLTTVRYAVEGGVATLTLDRPEARNALNRAMCDDIVAATPGAPACRASAATNDECGAF
jgi:enoyl-CoA hydratase/carnithine racemase